MQFILDENIPYKIAQALSILEESNLKTKYPAKITSIKALNKEGAPDEEVIVIAGEMDAIIFTFDKDFKHLKSYAPLYKKHKVGVVLLKLGKEDSTYWGIVKLLVTKWEDVKKELNGKPKPLVYQLNKLGIQRQDF